MFGRREGEICKTDKNLHVGCEISLMKLNAGLEMVPVCPAKEGSCMSGRFPPCAVGVLLAAPAQHHAVPALCTWED